MSQLEGFRCVDSRVCVSLGVDLDDLAPSLRGRCHKRFLLGDWRRFFSDQSVLSIIKTRHTMLQLCLSIGMLSLALYSNRARYP